MSERELNEDGYEIVRPLKMPQRKGIECGVCGMRFDDGKAYGYCCPQVNCPIQPKVT